MEQHKVCTKCGENKPFSEYYTDKSRTDKKRGSCGVCDSAYSRGWKKANPVNDEQREKRRLRSKKHREENPDYAKGLSLKTLYGITFDEYNDMFIEQGGSCAICGKHQSEMKKSIHVDHCHATGKVRGLLCSNCNTALGLLKEDINIVRNVLKYLEIAAQLI